MRRVSAVSPCGGLQPCHHAAGFSRVTMRRDSAVSPCDFQLADHLIDEEAIPASKTVTPWL